MRVGERAARLEAGRAGGRKKVYVDRGVLDRDEANPVRIATSRGMVRCTRVRIHGESEFIFDPALPEKEFCDQDCYRLYMAYRAMDVYR
jgi:hypothetical protein